MGPLAYALVQDEPDERTTWLSFPRMPPEEVRSALRGAGWTYHGELRSWAYPSLSAPARIVFGRGRTCDYSRLATRPYAKHSQYGSGVV